MINDFAGMIMITIGVSKIRAFEIDLRYEKRMQFVFCESVLNCIDALFGICDSDGTIVLF
jgi:hypothetical protein